MFHFFPIQYVQLYIKSVVLLTILISNSFYFIGRLGIIQVNSIDLYETKVVKKKKKVISY